MVHYFSKIDTKTIEICFIKILKKNYFLANLKIILIRGQNSIRSLLITFYLFFNITDTVTIVDNESYCYRCPISRAKYFFFVNNKN